jgi:hypothetical protein
MSTGCENEKCSGSVGFWLGSVAAVEALSRRLHSPPFKSLGALQPIRCGGSTRGGLFTCLFWALCRSLLSHPNYIISTVAKVEIGGVLGGRFAPCLLPVCAFFGVLLLWHGKLLGISTEVFLCHACYMITRP